MRCLSLGVEYTVVLQKLSLSMAPLGQDFIHVHYAMLQTYRKTQFWNASGGTMSPGDQLTFLTTRDLITTLESFNISIVHKFRKLFM